MTYEKYCSEFMSKGFIFEPQKITMDAKAIQNMVDQNPQYAERWFFDLPKNADKETVELFFPVLALVAVTLSERHGITGPFKCFKKE